MSLLASATNGRRPFRAVLPAFTAALLLVCGCGSDDDDESGGLSESAVAAFVGTYRVTAYTSNANGCDAEGPSMLETLSDTQLVLADQVFLGQRSLQLASCKDDTDCAAKWTAIRTSKPYASEYIFTLSSQTSENVLGGFSASGGPSEQEGLCRREYSVHSLSMAEDGALRFESRLKRLADQPERDGVCWVEPARFKRDAEGRPCSTLTVLEATPAG